MYPEEARDLPIADVMEELRLGLREADELVLQAPPGAGKTTIVPLALLDEPWLAGRKILVLEPRRIAARAAAARLAQLLGESLGQTVGYRIRLDSCISAQTRIEVITEGILTRQLQRDPGLEEVLEEDPAEERHREGLDQPVHEERDQDAARAAAHAQDAGQVDAQHHRVDHQPEQHRNRRVDLAALAELDAAERVRDSREELAQPDARDHAERHPER